MPSRRRRTLVAVASIVLAVLIAGLDWLLPQVQLAYLECLPVLLITATFGIRIGVALAIVVSIPVTILEYAGAFRLRDSSVPLDIAVMAVVLTVLAVVFYRYLRAARLHNTMREREMFVALAQNSSDFVGMTDPAGNIVYGNQAALDLLAIDDTRGLHFLDCFAPEDRPFVNATILPAIERDGRWVGEFKMRNISTGTTFPIWYNAFALTNAQGERLGLATISRDITERRRIEIGLRTLVAAGEAMYRSLDHDATLRNLADAVVRTFATACTIDVLDERGAFRRVAAAHPDPALRALFAQHVLEARLAAANPIVRAIRGGESSYISTIDDAWKATQRPLTVAAFDERGIRSFITVPVRRPDGTPFGALTCCIGRDDSRPAYVSDDVPFAEELGRRAGIAVEHARAYERERAIAVRFQAASLPGALPRIAGIALAADYRPGDSEATVGGDWYDAFLLSDGRIAITIGDVLGKGLEAAVTMARVRLAMRSAALLQAAPSALLRVAEATVGDVSRETYATALAAIYDPAARTLTFASAGHPGPLIRHAGGIIAEVAASGPMLGLHLPPGPEMTIGMPAGTMLAFFTDGLSEATRDSEDGYRRLHAALADDAVAHAENPAHAVIEHVLRGAPVRDDIAVLTATFDA